MNRNETFWSANTSGRGVAPRTPRVGPPIAAPEPGKRSQTRTIPIMQAKEPAVTSAAGMGKRTQTPIIPIFDLSGAAFGSAVGEAYLADIDCPLWKARAGESVPGAIPEPACAAVAFGLVVPSRR